MNKKKSLIVGVIVAHPDDETLWVGGTILSYPEYDWYIVSLCRGNDSDRAPKFYKALTILNAKGSMGNLNDGPEQFPLNVKEVENGILDLLPTKHFDLVISHNPTGEYTRHIRHEEIGKAVIKLWCAGKISTDEFWTFAYEDGNKNYKPRPIKNAHIYQTLTKRIWLMKYKLITETYGFEKNSWEAETTTGAESFWKFNQPNDAKKWFENSEIKV